MDRAGISSAANARAGGALADEDSDNVRSGWSADPDFGKPGYSSLAACSAAWSGRPDPPSAQHCSDRREGLNLGFGRGGYSELTEPKNSPKRGRYVPYHR